MNCPHCNVPLVNGLTVCPRCKYDTKTKDGGEKYIQWLVTTGALTPEEAAQRAQRAEQELAEYKKKTEAISKILVTSGFSFDGYKITIFKSESFGKRILKNGSTSFKNLLLG